MNMAIHMTDTEHPTVPFILSLIGGLLVFIDGVVIFLFGISGYVFRYHEYVPFIRPLVTAVGIWGIVCAIVVLIASFMLHRQPDQHTLWGILILVFSVLSITSGGGFIIGFILGAIGGIWALVWRPPEKKPEPSKASSP
jgi:hypothetical protein